MVNQSKNDALEATVTLADGQFTGDVLSSVINGPDIQTENTVDKPHQIAEKKTTIKAAGKSLTAAFEPHSVTTLVCPVG